jgi:RNA polymerase sigma-70 factor (ECF subfamily)
VRANDDRIRSVTSGSPLSYSGRDVDIDAQQDLVQRARLGDACAWELLYRNIYPKLRAYARARAAESETEDLINETMSRAVGAIGRFRWEASGFDAWLFGILRRVCAEHHRKQSRRDAVSRLGREIDDREPSDGLLLAEDHESVRSAFAQLSAAEQEVLELRVVAGLSAEDVAKVLGKRPGAIRTAQSRALSHLRGLMERHA